MGKVTLDSRGLIEHTNGSGVNIDIRVAGRVSVAGLTFYSRKPTRAEMAGQKVFWLTEEGELEGVDEKGKPLEIASKSEKKVPVKKPEPQPKAEAKEEPKAKPVEKVVETTKKKAATKKVAGGSKKDTE